MCLIDSSTSIDIDPDKVGDQYRCIDCNNIFRGIGKRIRCPSCESVNIKKIWSKGNCEYREKRHNVRSNLGFDIVDIIDMSNCIHVPVNIGWIYYLFTL